MNETEFHQVADRTLDAMFEALEAADAAGHVEVECEHGALSIGLPSGKQLLVSKHTPMRQLWLSSPVSGGLHFSYEEEWKLSDGRTLGGVLSQELQALAGVEIRF